MWPLPGFFLLIRSSANKSAVVVLRDKELLQRNVLLLKLQSHAVLHCNRDLRSNVPSKRFLDDSYERISVLMPGSSSLNPDWNP